MRRDVASKGPAWLDYFAHHHHASCRVSATISSAAAESTTAATPVAPTTHAAGPETEGPVTATATAATHPGGAVATTLPGGADKLCGAGGAGGSTGGHRFSSIVQRCPWPRKLLNREPPQQRTAPCAYPCYVWHDQMFGAGAGSFGWPAIGYQTPRDPTRSSTTTQQKHSLIQWSACPGMNMMHIPSLV